MLLGLEMRHSTATGVSSHHFIHIIWVYLDFIYNSSDYFNLTGYKQHLEIELESLEEEMGLEEVGSVILLALGCFLALFVQLGDLERQLCTLRVGGKGTGRRRMKSDTSRQGGKEKGWEEGVGCGDCDNRAAKTTTNLFLPSD